MKRKIFITMVCSMLAVFVLGQNKPASKAEIKAAKIEEQIQSGCYEITVNQVNPMNGRVRHLTPDYSVRISGDSSLVYLPYFGRAYSAPMNGEGGIIITNIMDDYKVSYNEKKKGYFIDFTAKGMNDTYRFSVTVWTNGSVSFQVTSNNRQSIGYSGYLRLPDE